MIVEGLNLGNLAFERERYATMLAAAHDDDDLNLGGGATLRHALHASCRR